MARWLVLALGVLVLACGEESPSMVPQRSTTEPTADEPPAPVRVAPDPRDVTFVTRDGVTIAATLAAAASPDAPAVILVHQLSSTRAEWAPLLERLHADPPFTTLAIDLRGHGLSVHGRSGTLDWQSFDDAAWAATREDVLAAVAYLASPTSGVAPASFAAVGSSIGSTAVIAAAADEPRLTALVALSPGRAYHGFDAITPAASLTGRGILAIVAVDETDNVDTASALGRIGAQPPLLVPGDAHGVLLFASDATTLDAAEDFLRMRLSWPRSAPRTATSLPAPPVTSAGTAAH